MTAVFEDVAAWRDERTTQLRRGVTLGFVPTMGALHEGHLSLVHRSRAENDRTLVSIFVNPTQFDRPEDLATYPRTRERDLALLQEAGVDYVLLPTEKSLYPDGFAYRVTEMERSRELEGALRPGHFDGVLTVVLKLLLMASADRAYFGEKDWQQLSLVRGMVEAFFLPTVIVPCPTIRNTDGLALSSRNARLEPRERMKAWRLYRTLCEAPNADAAAASLATEGFTVDYVEDREGRRLAAAWLGGVRLIDNVSLEGTR